MRSHLLRVVALTSLLSILLGSPLCMLVDCAPQKPVAMHPCCAAAAAKTAHGAKAPVHECGRPCCISIALPHAPELDAPASTSTYALQAGVLAPSLVLEPAAAHAPSPPGDDSRPPVAPPAAAAGTRAPPLA